MINTYDILETIRMIQDECLDIRTTTMGISLLDCADTDIDKACAKVYDKICTKAEKLVQTGEDIEREYGIPIINKRVSVTPIAIMAGISGGDPAGYRSHGFSRRPGHTLASGSRSARLRVCTKGRRTFG